MMTRFPHVQAPNGLTASGPALSNLFDRSLAATFNMLGRICPDERLGKSSSSYAKVHGLFGSRAMIGRRQRSYRFGLSTVKLSPDIDFEISKAKALPCPFLYTSKQHRDGRGKFVREQAERLLRPNGKK